MIETTVSINGMACGMCESHVNDVIRQNFQIKKVTSSHKKGEAVVLSEQELDEEKLRSAIGTTGYEVTAVSSQQYEKKGLFGRKK